MGGTLDRRPGTDVTEHGLRHLLNEWDPIGVADYVQDEYACMLAPLFQQLREGADQAEIGNFLRHELEDHFERSVIDDRPHFCCRSWPAGIAHLR
ncbi:hypothetical protein ACFWFI_03390 [Streptomyces sp. NPDC060209]|uniref:hypothetical protein n=1 Tax=Streptomyces sp. NPDC060209 TaxID=3347073 RepID=UPI003650173B